jgi:alpha-D-ribose 1-methylphosphonate 5-triphosphate synthase subunit PhnL
MFKYVVQPFRKEKTMRIIGLQSNGMCKVNILLEGLDVLIRLYMKNVHCTCVSTSNGIGKGSNIYMLTLRYYFDANQITIR